MAKFIKRIGQVAIVIYNVFFGPVPVPEQLTVWPRVIIALAILMSLPLIALMKPGSRWRVLITVLAVLSIMAGVALGIFYWIALPTRTLQLEVRGGLYVVGVPTDETKQALIDRNASLPTFIDGNPHLAVETFFIPDTVKANKFLLAFYYIPFIALTTIGIMVLLEWSTP
jgi:hypothetical protein